MNLQMLDCMVATEPVSVFVSATYAWTTVSRRFYDHAGQNHSVVILFMLKPTQHHPYNINRPPESVAAAHNIFLPEMPQILLSALVDIAHLIPANLYLLLSEPVAAVLEAHGKDGVRDQH